VSGRCRSAGALLEILLADNRDVVDEPEVLDEDMTPLGYWRKVRLQTASTRPHRAIIHLLFT
jgi:hypothetical protein